MSGATDNIQAYNILQVKPAGALTGAERILLVQNGVFRLGDVGQLIAKVSIVRVVVEMDDERLVADGTTWTLVWDAALKAAFGDVDESAVRVYFINDDGSTKEQRGIQPVFSRVDGKIYSVTLELDVEVNFKLIITV